MSLFPAVFCGILRRANQLESGLVSMPEFSLRNCKIGVVGLGYVGLPLAVEFGKHFRTVGFDIKAARVAELKKGRDSTLEVRAGRAARGQAPELLDRA